MASARRVAVVASAAAGGLLAGGFLSSALAVADTYEYVPDPLFGALFNVASSGIPGVDQQIYGVNLYDIEDVTGNPANPDTVGHLVALISNQTNVFGGSNQQLVVEPYGSSGLAPAGGSVFDTETFGGGYQIVYTDLVGAGAGGTNLITETLHTPYGDIVIPTTFDASSAVTALTTQGFGPITDAGHTYDYLPTGGSVIGGAATGIPGVDQQISGAYFYDVDDVTGNPTSPDTVGQFLGVASSYTNVLGGSNQQLVVELNGSSGLAPAGGSVFDTETFGGGYQIVYTDLVGAGAGGTNLITETLHTPYGDVVIPTTFDASTAVTTLNTQGFGPITDAGHTYDYVAENSGSVFGGAATGTPGVDEQFSSLAYYDVNDVTGNPTDPATVGHFFGVASSYTNVFGVSNHQLVVESNPFVHDSGVYPAAGSVFDTETFGGGYQIIYTDLVGAGAGGTNLITETFDTPFGDFSIPTTFDASAVVTALADLGFGPYTDAAGATAAAGDPAFFTDLLGLL